MNIPTFKFKFPNIKKGYSPAKFKSLLLQKFFGIDKIYTYIYEMNLITLLILLWFFFIILPNRKR